MILVGSTPYTRTTSSRVVREIHSRWSAARMARRFCKRTRWSHGRLKRSGNSSCTRSATRTTRGPSPPGGRVVVGGVPDGAGGRGHAAGFELREDRPGKSRGQASGAQWQPRMLDGECRVSGETRRRWERRDLRQAEVAVEGGQQRQYLGVDARDAARLLQTEDDVVEEDLHRHRRDEGSVPYSRNSRTTNPSRLSSSSRWASARSSHTISRTSSARPVVACQPSRSRALPASPRRVSTSVGRK